MYFKGEFGNCSIEPITLGHEFSGVVVESGVNVLLKKGTKVQYVNQTVRTRQWRDYLGKDNRYKMAY